MTTDFYDDLISKIMVLNETVWSGAQVSRSKVDNWLNNFRGEVRSKKIEKLHALYVLSHFLYYGVPEFREMLRVVYRDLYLYPIIQDIRASLSGVAEHPTILELIAKEIAATRFIGMGSPSESGSMLLYLFRQINNISVDKFVHSHEIFSRYADTKRLAIRNRAIRHYVFLDDLCGSGTQAIEYSRDIVSQLKEKDPKARTCYYVLFSTVNGIEDVRQQTAFDSVECVFELDDSFRAFEANSRYFASGASEVRRDWALEIFEHYGSKLWSDHPLGYKNGQLLLGFWHNTPDNTLPTIWFNEKPSVWTPVFERFHKI